MGGRRKFIPLVLIVMYVIVRELFLEIVFGSAGDWLKDNAGFVGHFLAWRWSSLIVLAACSAAYLVIVTRWSDILSLAKAGTLSRWPHMAGGVAAPTVLAGRSLAIEVLRQYYEFGTTYAAGDRVSSRPPVATIEVSLCPSHPMELSRVILVIYDQDGDGTPLEVDEVRQERQYLDNPFPQIVERPGVHNWSFELPDRSSESAHYRARLAFLADGRWWDSEEFQVFLQGLGAHGAAVR